MLLKKSGLVKSRQFKKHQYIGDALNAVRIFNEFNVDELIFLDIDASIEKRVIDFELVKHISEEAHMPFAVGGGISKIDDIQRLIGLGAEKVVIGKEAVVNPTFVKNASDSFGASTIVVCIDVKKNIFGKYSVVCENGKLKSNHSPIEFSKLMQSMGAGEIIVQSVDNDGMRNGYDEKVVLEVSKAIHLPIVALGGAGTLDDMQKLYKTVPVSGLGAGSLFLFHEKPNSILINYPEKKDFVRYGQK